MTTSSATTTAKSLSTAKTFVAKIKKIPIPVAFLVTIVGLLGGILFINKSQTIFSRALSQSTPRNIKITNVGSTSFVVSWVTDNASQGYINYGEDTNSINERSNDLRDTNTAQPGQYLTHFVIVDNLKAEGKFYFKVVAGGKSYGEGTKPFTVSTGPQKIPSDNDLAQGRILNSEGQPSKGSIVYLSLPNTINQAALTDENGNWMIPLSTARTSDLQNFSNYDRNAQVEEIFVQGEKETASASITTAKDNPCPDMTLGQTYNFLTEANNNPTTGPTIIQNSFSNNQGFNNSSSSQNLAIISPAENEKINTYKPEFIGTGPNSKDLDILIESDEKITAKVKVDQVGNWKWTPPSSLSPGSHKITVSYTDKDGFVQKITRNFTILAAGQSDLPSYTATPSGQRATNTPIPSVIPSPTPTKTSSTGPTISVAPTEIPTTTVTSVPTISTVPTEAGRTTIPSTTGTPKTGTSLPTWVFLGTGSAILLVGLALIIL